jgi:uroporphyrin-III C-methyltransferase/precorrin-2 dehydrogenase/sirohydrochlorin ferrochelatase
MEFLPIFLKVQDRPCLVVGGGRVAARKLRPLLKAGATIRLVAPTLATELQAHAAAGTIRHDARTFADTDLDGALLVIAATDNPELNQHIARQADARGIPVNVVDDPGASSFVTPSIIDRSPVLVAIGTGGSSPTLSRLLRARFESMTPAGYGHLAEFTARFRDVVKQRIPDPDNRKRFWDRVLQGGVAERIFAGQTSEAEMLLTRELARPQEQTPIGEVYLVGAGPGDPDLVSFRAMRLMQQADVVLYDRLVAPPILEMVRREAERIYVGKERNRHALPQEQINALLARLAKEGKRVLRLKGGDPFIFGRGGEEIDTLAAEGIPFQVVPGITAASGCASYSGIPLTHRDYAQSVTFVTGHLKDGSINLNWSQLAEPNQTVVFYMGLQGLPEISRQLMAHGVPADMPAALIQRGTTPDQRIFTGSLQELPALVAREEIRPPTLLIVGEVIKLREKLTWYHSAAEAVSANREEPANTGSE